MNADELRTHLLGEKDQPTTLNWLHDRFLPRLLEVLNTQDVRRRLGIYGGERVPENERNLTDVRNRVSLILEYETARIASQILDSAGVKEIFLTYVVANRFPDLEVHTAEGKRGLRFEIKCLQSLAEEKSANFDTLRKDVHPRTDFLFVHLWEWQFDSGDIAWNRAPRILKVFSFNAAALAHLRDWYWLNQPPNNLRQGLQGFDLRYAVNCRNGRYNQEEGNYGKLLRIWTEEFPYPPNWTPLLKRTEGDYLAFKAEVVRVGFDTLSTRLLGQFAGTPAIDAVALEGKQVGWRAGSAAFLMKGEIGGKQKQESLFKSLGLTKAIVFSDKYVWTELKIDAEGIAEEVASGMKPKYLITRLGPSSN